MDTAQPGADRRALLQSALQSLDEMQARLDAAEYARREPIAIVGMSCRFPGQANSPEDYWTLLCEGRDAVGELSPERRALVGLADAADGAFQGGFLDGIEGFDPQLFGISPREATSMDPQQRLVLEVAWEALERSGIAPDSLSGSATGVFVGITTNDYGQLLRRDGSALDVYAATGSALNAAPGRLAYLLGLQGPAVAVDSACSSSLVAVHLAVQSLRNGESNLALAGGVNITLLPEAFECFTAWGMLAGDARSKAFDESADGFVRGEGCGIVSLKRLSDAQANGDPILAVIRGSAVNQDGRSAGLTVPSGTAQRAVIEAALRNARVEPAQLQYVEAHGTGTSLGDPIEVEALGGALGRGRNDDSPLYLGSVKTNLGHLESAAGIAGLIKVVLMLQHGQIPPHLHLKQRSAGIPWPTFPIEIPTTLTSWPASDLPRVAGVSGFGLSGTNAHVVVEEAPTIERAPADVTRSRHPVVLSARDETALRQLAGRYATQLSVRPDLSLANVSATSGQGRAHLPQRLALSAASLADAAELLAAFAAGQAVNGVVTGQAPLSGRPRPVFLFTGQGSQYPDMGLGLYEISPVYRDALDRCSELLTTYLDRPLLDVIFAAPGPPDEALLNQTAYTQPALFALEYALAQLWQSWGIRPAAVAGHSLGEFVAACIAGVMGLEDAARLVAIRGRLMGGLPAGGAMAAIFAPADQVRQEIAAQGGVVSVAAVNGPAHTVVSGAADAVAKVSDTLEAGGARVQRLMVSHAFHSDLMEPILDQFEASARDVRFQSPRIPLVSNVTGEFWAPGEVPDASYWRRHLREAVQFDATMATLQQAGFEHFLEIGPHPVLSGMGSEAIPDGAAFLPSLRRNRDAWMTMLDSLGRLYVAGADVNWREVSVPYASGHADLPTYPFQRKRYWTKVTTGDASSAQRRHLLGRYVNVASDQDIHVWEGAIDTGSFPFIDDHRVQGSAILPATAYMEMALAAAVEVFGERPISVLDVEYQKPIIFRDDDSFNVQLLLRAGMAGEATFEVFSRPVALTGAGGWTANVRGALRFGDAVGQPARVDPGPLRERCHEHIDGETFYRRLAELGNQWGPTFQGVTELWRGNREALSLVEVPDELRTEVGNYQFHPAVADACGHVLTATLPLDERGEHDGAFVGGGIDEARLYRRPSGTTLWAYARLRPDDDERANVLVGDVQVFDDDGELVSETIGARLWYLDEQQQQPIDPANWMYTLEWEPQDVAVPSPDVQPPGTWLLLADSTGVADSLASELQRLGHRCVVARLGSEYGSDARDAWRVRPDSRTDLQRFVADAAGSDDVRGVIHLWGLDAAGSSDLRPHDLAAVQEKSLFSALYLIQALGSAQIQSRPRIWFVTRGGQAAGGEMVDPVQAPIWGMSRALALEQSELWGGLIDLGPDDDSTAIGMRIAQEVDQPREDQVALRGDTRYVARMSRPESVPPPVPLTLRADASYLITGGFGGLGLRLASRLVSRGARHVILLGRTSLPPRTEWDGLDPESRAAAQVAAIRELEANGASVHVALADVADEDRLRAALDDVSQAGAPPVVGVFHAAGTLSHGTLDMLDAETLRSELRAKLVGGWTLHRVFAGLSLDYFVLFSSASALLSSPRLGAYAAANAFLDALAHHRFALGLPALSVNWGLWGEVGMAAQFDSDDVALLALRGMGVIAPEQGMDILERLLQGDRPQVAVLPVDWSRWRQRYPAFTRAPLLSKLFSDSADSLDGPTTLDAAMLTAAALDERPALVEAYLAEQVSRVLGMSMDDLDRATPLSAMGIDSLMAVELKNRIELDLGIVVPMVALLQGPSVSGLAGQVLELFASEGSTMQGEPLAVEPDELDEVEDLLARLDQLSDADVESLLADLTMEKVAGDD